MPIHREIRGTIDSCCCGGAHIRTIHDKTRGRTDTRIGSIFCHGLLVEQRTVALGFRDSRSSEPTYQVRVRHKQYLQRVPLATGSYEKLRRITNALYRSTKQLPNLLVGLQSSSDLDSHLSCQQRVLLRRQFLASKVGPSQPFQQSPGRVLGVVEFVELGEGVHGA